MSNDKRDNDDNQALARDANRDPITGAPGSHPVGVGVGGIAGGAAAGAAAGTFLGPIGTLVGAAVGVIAGAAVGKGVAERIDPTGEAEYWRGEYKNRPYAKPGADYDRDYASAYGLGLQARESDNARSWEESENALKQNWDTSRGQSTLSWDEARGAVQDAWNRTDATHRTYQATDDYFAERHGDAPFAKDGEESYSDYQPAYRYGARARTLHRERNWDDSLESELRDDWDAQKGTSPLTWDRAKEAVRDAFTSHDRYNHATEDRANSDKFDVK